MNMKIIIAVNSTLIDVFEILVICTPASQPRL
jgi:hypothetical protein